MMRGELELLEQIFCVLGIQYVNSLGLSQQFKTQQRLLVASTSVRAPACRRALKPDIEDLRESVPESQNNRTLKDAEVAGFLPVISATAESRKDRIIRGLTGGTVTTVRTLVVGVVNRFLETYVASIIPCLFYYQWPC